MKPPKAVVFLAALCIGMPSMAQEGAESVSSVPGYSESEDDSFIDFEVGYASITTNLSATTSLDTAINYKFGITPKLGLVVQVGQGLNTAGFGTLYTTIAGGLSWAFTGSHKRKTSLMTIDGVETAEIKPFSQGGIFFQGLFKQMFFNGEDDVVPLVGSSFSLTYRFSSAATASYAVGGSFDMASNGDRTLTSGKVFFSIGLWM